MSSTRMTRSPGGDREAAPELAPDDAVVAADLLGEDRPRPQLAAGLEGQDHARRSSGRRPGRRRRRPPASRCAAAQKPHSSLVAGGVLEDLELLEVGVRVAAALEQEMTVAEGAGAAEQLLGPVGDRRPRGVVDGGADGRHVGPQSSRAARIESGRRAGSGPVLDALRGRALRASSGGRSRSAAGTIRGPAAGTRPRNPSMSRIGSVGSAKTAVPTWTAHRPDGQEVEHVAELRDAADRDDRDVHDLGDLVDDPQRDRLDGRPRQPAVDVAEQRTGPIRPDGDPGQRVDGRDRVGAGPARWPGRSGRTSATFGDSLTSSGRSVARRTAAVTAPAASASIANWSPPLPTFGQLMFSSIPATPGTPSSRRATST